MIKITTSKFTKVEELLNVLKNNDYNKDTAILGGHYVLDYSEKQNKLVPLINGENNEDKFNIVAEREYGFFPAKTFKYAVDLQKHISKEQGANSKIMLLVNDHKLPSLFIKPVGISLSSLRQDYYMQNDIPRTFKKIADDNNSNINTILLENTKALDSKKNGSKFLFSEYTYRKKFDKSLKKHILKYTDYFYSEKRSNGKKDVYIKDDRLIHSCLTQGGTCGCSGEIMEFLQKRYLKDNFKNFILFVPSSCNAPVSSGVVSILYYLKLKHNINDIKVDLISDMPCDNLNTMINYQKISYE